ncbi:30S ribosomal protein S6 [Candidatus Babeliales bacterium]|nr:30S ribosomal protein S6 [Candidatus Babeliales bacterium]MCF7899764.1 30S ribosomal protein S6 [Candidatus Babeliales bacterium]
MFRYETLMLTHPQLTTDELSAIEKHFDKMLSDVSGKVISFDRWGKYRLSYPVQKNDYGIYILVRFDVPGEMSTKIMKEIDSFFKIKVHDIVMRFVIKKIDPSSPSTYLRPDPVDSVRSGGVDSFIKEHKMETFLSDAKPDVEDDFQDSNEN